MPHTSYPEFALAAALLLVFFCCTPALAEGESVPETPRLVAEPAPETAPAPVAQSPPAPVTPPAPAPETPPAPAPETPPAPAPETPPAPEAPPRTAPEAAAKPSPETPARTVLRPSRENESMRKVHDLLEQSADRLAEAQALLDAARRENAATLAAAHNGVKKNGQLRVQGNQLLNAEGLPVQLRGMSTHGLHWYPQFTGTGAIRYIKNLGANLFRLAMYASGEHGGYSENMRTRGINYYLLTTAADNALSEDMYTIIDWHVLRERNPLLTLDHAKVFFEQISLRYAKNPGVLYEICNEPNGETTWADIAKYAEEVIPVIRKNSPEAVILVGTPQYSSDLESIKTAPLSIPNIMYSFHAYPRPNATHYETLLDGMLQEGYPIFVTEWGVYVDPKTGEVAMEAAGRFLDFLQKRKLSWVNWSLSNKDEAYSAIASHSPKLEGWTEEELTPSAKLVFPAFGGE